MEQYYTPSGFRTSFRGLRRGLPRGESSDYAEGMTPFSVGSGEFMPRKEDSSPGGFLIRALERSMRDSKDEAEESHLKYGKKQGVNPYAAFLFGLS